MHTVAPPEQAFRLQNGASARSIEELEARLREAPPGVAWFHREHFGPWVRDILHDDGLARRLQAFASTPDGDAYRDIVLGLLRARSNGLSPR